jgi:hypothetical protein
MVLIGTLFCSEAVIQLTYFGFQKMQGNIVSLKAVMAILGSIIAMLIGWAITFVYFELFRSAGHFHIVRL